MYIDAKKFDYEKFSYPDAHRLIERDKEFAREAYRKWINEAAEGIVERQWEVLDVGAIEKTGDFVKLLKEAEFTYSIGAFTSSIALVGVCAEDLCRFFSTSAGHNLDSNNQHSRVKVLLDLGIISEDIADKLNVIRRLRNDCLHYNSGFKQKNSTALQADALNALNCLKEVYATIAGVVDYQTVDSSRVCEMILLISREAASSQPGAIGVDVAVSRMRNVFGSAFGMDLSMNDSRPVYKTSIFKVEEVDLSDPAELTLLDLTSGFIVIVDIIEGDIIGIQNNDVSEGDIITATVMSVPNKLDITGSWRLWSPITKLT